MEPEKTKEYENKIMVLHKKRLNPIFTKKKLKPIIKIDYSNNGKHSYPLPKPFILNQNEPMKVTDF